ARIRRRRAASPHSDRARPSAEVSAATSTAPTATGSNRAAARGRERRWSATAKESRRRSPARACACFATRRRVYQTLDLLAISSSLELAINLALGIGQRRLGILATQQHVL